jgi:hypothetical protein
MQTQYAIAPLERQALPWSAVAGSEAFEERLARFLAPVLMQLDQELDKRLVRTLWQTVEAIITLRDRANGLLLSELGGAILSPAQAPAGTKRLSRLIHSPRWDSALLEQFLWQRATAQLARWEAQQQTVLALWDSSVLEKTESRHLEGLCPVHSSKAARRTRVRKGYYHPPVGRICVPGMHWEGVLLVSRDERQAAPVLAAMRWWSSRGVQASFVRDEQGKILLALAAVWGRRVIHVFDQGYAGAFWLHLCLAFQLRFVLRWRGDYHLLDAAGVQRAAWQIAQGKRAWEQRTQWDGRKRRSYQASVLALPVRHPELPAVPLWLVVCRGLERPWYLLTNEPAATASQAWEVVRSYRRRWQLESTWRYDKSELAFESPRLWQWAHRVKLLWLATLASAFLLSLLDPHDAGLRRWLLRTFCHRTGQLLQQVAAPLYRLRSALSRLWQHHPPTQAWLARQRRSPPRPVTVTEFVADS